MYDSWILNDVHPIKVAKDTAILLWIVDAISVQSD